TSCRRRSRAPCPIRMRPASTASTWRRCSRSAQSRRRSARNESDRHTRVVAANESSKKDEGVKVSSGELQYYVPQEILDVHFPHSVRGYDRDAVDKYVKRVNRVIAELKVRGSPPAAVRHALEQAEGKVQGLLQAAREAAE